METASFKKDSPKINIHNILLALISERTVNTVTGSVADIREPNAND